MHGVYKDNVPFRYGGGGGGADSDDQKFFSLMTKAYRSGLEKMLVDCKGLHNVCLARQIN